MRSAAAAMPMLANLSPCPAIVREKRELAASPTAWKWDDALWSRILALLPSSTGLTSK